MQDMDHRVKHAASNEPVVGTSMCESDLSCDSDSTARDSVLDLMLKIGTPQELAIEIRRRKASLEMLQHYHDSWQQQLQDEAAGSGPGPSCVSLSALGHLNTKLDRSSTCTGPDHKWLLEEHLSCFPYALRHRARLLPTRAWKHHCPGTTDCGILSVSGTPVLLSISLPLLHSWLSQSL